MRARIINYGYRKVFPTCLGNLRLLPNRPYEFTNARAVNELRNYKDIQIEILEEDKPIDYSKYPIGQLRKIATKVGIKGSFFMKKIELIKKLEGKNVTTI